MGPFSKLDFWPVLILYILVSTLTRHDVDYWRDYILFLLNGVGAKRCGPDQSGCSLGCVTGGCYNGRPKSTLVSSPENQKRG